jgi:hypothetical protein
VPDFEVELSRQFTCVRRPRFPRTVLRAENGMMAINLYEPRELAAAA